jgi:hypothetical protein
MAYNVALICTFITGVLLMLLQIIDIAIHVRSNQGTWQHIGANAIIIADSLVLMVMVKLRMNKKAFAIAATAGLIGYLVFVVLFLTAHSAGGPIFWVLLAGTILLLHRVSRP